jgi:hypothetical protein
VNAALINEGHAAYEVDCASVMRYFQGPVRHVSLAVCAVGKLTGLGTERARAVLEGLIATGQMERAVVRLGRNDRATLYGLPGFSARPARPPRPPRHRTRPELRRLERERRLRVLLAAVANGAVLTIEDAAKLIDVVSVKVAVRVLRQLVRDGSAAVVRRHGGRAVGEQRRYVRPDLAADHDAGAAHLPYEFDKREQYRRRLVVAALNAGQRLSLSDVNKLIGVSALKVGRGLLRRLVDDGEAEVIAVPSSAAGAPRRLYVKAGTAAACIEQGVRGHPMKLPAPQEYDRCERVRQRRRNEILDAMADDAEHSASDFAHVYGGGRAGYLSAARVLRLLEAQGLLTCRDESRTGKSRGQSSRFYRRAVEQMRRAS